MIERRKIIKSQSSPPVHKFSKRKERVKSERIKRINASRATHRKSNNANHRRSLSLSLFQTRARERELSLPRSAVKEKDRRTKREREREREIFGKISQNEPAISLSNVSISSTRRNFLSQTAREYKKNATRAPL